MADEQDIIIFHEYGHPSHFSALTTGSDHSFSYYETDILRSVYASLKRRDLSGIRKAWKNIRFFFSQGKIRDRVVVVALAPFDKKIRWYSRLIRQNSVIYFSSWPYWDGSFHPKEDRGLSKKATRRKWKAFLEKQVSHIVTVTETAGRSLRENYSITSPMTVIPHSFRKEDFYPADKQESKDMKVLFISRFEDGKGHDILSEMLKEEPVEGMRYTLIGDGSKKAEIVENLEPFDEITIMEATSDRGEMRRLLQSHDILILPSYRVGNWEELFGMVIIEAMACGTVVIAADCVGPKEIIEDGKNGLLIPQKQSIPLRQALTRLRDEKELYEKLRTEGLSYVQRYELSNNRNLWNQVLKTIRNEIFPCSS